MKTRLAKTIGTQGAFDVYSYIVELTEAETQKMNCDKRIYFSDAVIDTKWNNTDKFVQKGNDLGQRMKNAFNEGFEDGYKRIILIGSDLPDINSDIMNEGLNSLKQREVVFGKAEDGGYYLVGMTKMIDSIFDDKPWSTENLLELTLAELSSRSVKYTLLKELNDVDTIEDLVSSSIFSRFRHFKSA